MLREALHGRLAFLAYYVIMVVLLFTVRRMFRLSGELFRKLFHISVAASVFVLLHMFQTWYLAALAALGFGVVVYFVMGFAERYPSIMRALEERKPGEVRSSLLLMFFTIAALIALGWGWLGPTSKYMVIVPIMAWGFGDAAAALVGKRWGRRHLRGRWVDNKKTVEGTWAMFAFAAAAILVTLIGSTAWPWYVDLAVAVLVAPVAAFTELVTRDGLDTITVPFATFAALLVVTQTLALMGVV